MKVKVKVWGTLRKPVKPEIMIRELPSDATLKDLLDGLDEFIDLNDIFFVTVNGMIIDRADYSRVKLMNGDTIAIVPIVMGG